MGNLLRVIFSLFITSQAFAIVGPIPGPIPVDHPAHYNTIALVKKMKGLTGAAPTYKIFCSGVILSENLILTAKHCVGDLKVSEFFIYFGDDTNNIDEDLLRTPNEWSGYGPADWQSYFPSFDSAWVKIHGRIPNYDGTRSDLPRYRAVPILTDAARLARAKAIYMAGYGNQETQMMKVFAGEKKHVATGFKQYINTAQVVSLTLLQGERGHSNCHGDSGGPAYALVPNSVTGRDEWFVFGTAAGFDLALTPESYQKLDDEDFPYIAHCDRSQTLYTFIGDYVNWIESSARQSLLKSANSPIERPGVTGPLHGEQRSFQDWCETASYLDAQWLTVRKMLVDAMESTSGQYTEAEVFLDCAKAQEVLNLLTRMEFDSSGEKFGDLKPVAALENLRELYFSQTPIPDLTPFIGGALQKIAINKVALESFEEIPGLLQIDSLRELKLTNSQIKSLEPLGSLMDLRVLDVGRNNIEDVSPLASLSNLREVNFGANKVSDMSPLYSLENLEILVGSNNQLVSVPAPDNTWPRLKEVYLINNQLTDFDFLRDSKQLARKALTGNPGSR